MITDITPEKQELPPRSVWHTSINTFPMVANYATFKETLAGIEGEYGIHFTLDPDCVYNTAWPVEYADIAKYSYPLCQLTEDTGLRRDLLVLWEVCYEFFYKHLIEILKNYAQSAKSRGVKYVKTQVIRSAHICDNRAIGARVMQGITRRLSRSISASISWRWVSTYGISDASPELVTSMNPDNWAAAITNNCDLSPANIRAWKNKISMTLRAPDLIVGSSADTIGNIVIALITLAPAGVAIVPLVESYNAGVASFVHIFRQCFARSVIYHATADDRLYLCGIDYLNNLNDKYKDLLVRFQETYTSGNQCPFTTTYVQSGEFLDTIDHIIAALAEVSEWRIAYYEKALSVAEDRPTGDILAGSVVEYVAQQYKDRSEMWAVSVSLDRGL